MLRFDAYMVKYKDKYWIEANTDWTLVQKLNEQSKNKTTLKNNTQIASRFEVYSKAEFFADLQNHYTQQNTKTSS